VLTENPSLHYCICQEQAKVGYPLPTTHEDSHSREATGWF